MGVVAEAGRADAIGKIGGGLPIVHAHRVKKTPDDSGHLVRDASGQIPNLLLLGRDKASQIRINGPGLTGGEHCAEKYERKEF